MPREADRVAEISTSTGTGSMTLSGATAGYRSWSAGFGASNVSVHYGIVHDTNGTWEVGIGTFLPGSNAIQRDLVLASSSGGGKIAFASGNKVVYCQQPAENALRVQVRRSSDVGIEVIPAASQSGAMIRVQAAAGGDAFVVAPTGKVTSAGGLSLGSALAAGVTDLSRHLDLYGGTFGLGVTASRINHVVPASSSHDFYVDTARVARVGAGGVDAPLAHSQDGGYFRIGAHSAASYGTGTARIYYDATNRRLNVGSDNAGVVDAIALGLDGLWLNGDSAGGLMQGRISSSGGNDLTLKTSGTMTIFRDSAGTMAGRVDAPGTSAANAATVMTREKGDARYAAISSLRYKDGVDVAARVAGFLELDVKQWVLGGSLAADDYRRGREGYGHVAEDVVVVFPAGVENDEQGRPDRLNVGAMLGALHAEIKHLSARVDVMEAA